MIRVHHQFYRLPEGTLQLAKISQVWSKDVAEFKGLDDITIDPEGIARPFSMYFYVNDLMNCF